MLKQFAVVMSLALFGACQAEDAEVGAIEHGIMAGAGYTTFDAVLGGCKDSPNGVNCNNYERKEAVYTSGGPAAAGLADGAYFFAVVEPGHQHGGFVDGAEGNLSDDFDLSANRTFQVAAHELVGYDGSHLLGTSPSGRPIVALAPFADTGNPGGVYILAICQVDATAPSACKYDAFRIDAGTEPPPPLPVVSGGKYYDANASGAWDRGEPGIAGWAVSYTDGVTGVLFTGADGRFVAEFVPDAAYHFAELPGGGAWRQTGNLVDQTTAAGGATVVLEPDKTYTVALPLGSAVTGVYFGNLCLGAGGGHTLGFWSNRNGAALFGAEDLAAMVALDLRDGGGAAFDPVAYDGFRSWLLAAKATNMAYMLSAQLAATRLNVLNGFVDGGALIYAPGVGAANPNGYASIGAVIAEADAALAANGSTPAGAAARPHQEALKNALDAANNNLTFVQPGPASCPAPMFPL